jgi:hypothetical protein
LRISNGHVPKNLLYTPAQKYYQIAIFLGGKKHRLIPAITDLMFLSKLCCGVGKIPGRNIGLLYPGPF